jgi:hypothetical protein
MLPVVYQGASAERFCIGLSHTGRIDDISDVFGRTANHSEVLTPAPNDPGGPSTKGTVIEPVTIPTESKSIELQPGTVVTVVGLGAHDGKVMAACLASVAGRVHRFSVPVEQIRTESIF